MKSRIRINIKGTFNGLGDGGRSRLSTPATSLLAKDVIPFAATATPTISDYQTYYTTIYGEHPTLQLKTIDGDGNYIVRNEQAKITMSAGLVDSISWDLPNVETGFIIIT